MSISEFTTASAWIVGLAIVALIATGWRKPARASVILVRSRRTSRGPQVIPISQLPAPLHQSTPWWRRVWAVVASSGIAVVMGAVLATVVSFAVAYSVVTLSDMLRR